MHAHTLHAHSLHAHACSTIRRMAFSPPAATTLDRRAWGALLVLCGALFLDGLDVSMVGVALPSIDSDLHLTTSTLQWIVSGYVLGYGGLLLLGGRAADLLGRRRVFVIALSVFAVASLLGAVASDGPLLIATRFLKGLSAAFTAPAGLSIITTTFAEGPARNKALAVYTATGASGFSMGLVFGGLLTELGWRWTFLLPAPIAVLLVLGALRLVPDDGRPDRAGRGFDVAGAGLVASAMLLFVFTIVEAPTAGWTSLRTTGSIAAVAALAFAFVAVEQRSAHPLVRLGILRSAALRRANLGAMAVFGGWVGFQFVGTLYLQQLRGWSALEMALAFLPAGLVVAVGAPRSGQLVDRFGTTRVTAVGMAAFVAAYALVLGVDADSPYLTALLPTMLLGGIGFMCAFGPLNVAATSGIADHEQGLASGLVSSSFQVGGAVVLAVVTAVMAAGVRNSTAEPSSPTALLDGYHAALLVPLLVAFLGLLVTVSGALPALVRALLPGQPAAATAAGEDVR
jgi:EmrB/QacA subfamily drug resistance transporter